VGAKFASQNFDLMPATSIKVDDGSASVGLTKRKRTQFPQGAIPKMQDCDGYGGSEFGRVGDDILFVVYAVRGDADHLISARLARRSIALASKRRRVGSQHEGGFIFRISAVRSPECKETQENKP